MFEEFTFEKIMSVMMADMPDGIDTSEGSLLYNACAKQAVRLEEAYLAMSGLEKNMYPDTADLEHLIRAGEERGCYIQQATYAEFEAEFNCEVPAGSRFNLDEFNYTVFRALGEGQHKYILGCETPGSEPNHVTGELEPIDYVDGFEWGRITGCTTQGKDMEDIELYRARVLATYDYRGFAGNREYYLSRIKELPGVFGCKVERVQAPSDRVKITIQGNDYRAPDGDTVGDVQDAVDPIVSSGEGVGIAPIGHRVTVQAVKETQVKVSCTVTYDTGYSYADLKTYIEDAVAGYLLELRKAWEGSSQLTVRVLQIEAAIVGIDGIVDVAGTKLNGSTSNLVLSDGSVPVEGVVTCS